MLQMWYDYVQHLNPNATQCSWKMSQMIWFDFYEVAGWTEISMFPF